ncbi:MAG TPA: hypothetical protein VNL69_09425, partial [Bacteroidota bacterium]|nr:hypothetical protein [Bacteroidota bacterium]
GYAFLYGVIGSLVGSNLGGVLYETMLKPFAGQAGVENVYRNFWLMFALLDVIAVAGLVLYNRYFAADTPATNIRARRIMLAIYSVLVLVGGWFFYTAALRGETVSYKTIVQSVIMLLIGAGGMVVSLNRRQLTDHQSSGTR